MFCHAAVSVEAESRLLSDMGLMRRGRESVGRWSLVGENATLADEVILGVRSECLPIGSLAISAASWKC
jgi:hypothetical protein